MTMPLRKIFPIFAGLLLLGAFIWVGSAAYAQIVDDTGGAWKKEDNTPVVVELFTSTNCSACMPADRILYDISKTKNVIALGCHIDYWDEKTLEDPTGLEACTYRQWAYRSSGMLSGTNIRVPHFMLNGVYSVDNSKTRLFYNRLAYVRNSNINKPGLIEMDWKDEDTVSIRMPDSNRDIDKQDSFSVWLIRYQDYIIQKVDEGQTAGRVLRFSNVVRDAKHIAKWHGKERLIEVDVDKPKGGPERGGLVTIIHRINGSEIIAAGKLPDYKLPGDAEENRPAQSEHDLAREAAPPAEDPPLKSPILK